MGSENDGQDQQATKLNDDDDDESVSSEESSEDELALDGELVRNPDAVVSSESDDDNDDAKRPALEGKDPSKKKKKQKTEETTLQVEFIFCDMAEKYFHGLKNLLHSSSVLYTQHSSSMADSMIQNVSVGTVVSTASAEGDTEGDVFGFASVLNVTTFQTADAIQFLKTVCLDHCPADRKDELRVILSGSTKRPAGFLLQGRMLNLPIEMVLTLHQQLIQDIDWAVENAGGGKEEQKSLDFGLILRLAPCERENSNIVFKYFDDEILADRAEFTFQFTFPPTDSTAAGDTSRHSELVTAMVLTKAGHRLAIEDVGRMVNS